jgi:hypothetical protein
MADSIATSAFDFLIKIGFLNLLVPFILFYAIVFGMLERTQLFAIDKKKGDSKNLHSLIAFALAITATAASYAVGITQNFLPVIGIASVVLLGLMMVLGMAFGEQFEERIIKNSKMYQAIIIGISGVLLVAALGVIAYNGLIVGTPCPMDGSLTGVNTLNPGPGECTNFMDIEQSGSALTIYVMGINVTQVGSQILTAEVMAIMIFIGVIALTLYFTTKKPRA